ncbi:MAG: TolB family protein, partial [Chloroflexota bacterium]
MARPTTAPFGSWRSPITPELVATGGVRLDFVQADGPDLYWLEGRPTEGGRYVLARRTPDGEIADVTPAGMNVRTTVHEYGGGAYTVRRGVVYFANFADQRLYRQLPVGSAEPITAEPEVEWGWRYADLRVTPDGRMVYCVRETHYEDREAVNEIVALPTNGSQAPTVAATGHDFFSSPRISRDGRRLAWVTWDHPRMPWDGSTLWTGDVARDGDGRVTNTRAVAGGGTESVMQPEWGADGRLYFVSDRTGWWNLYVWDETTGRATPLAPMEAECGAPQWVFHTRSYAFLGEDRVALSWTRDGLAHLGVLRLSDGSVEEIETPYISFGYNSVGEVSALPVAGTPRIATIGASASEGPAVVAVDTDSAEITVIKRSSGQAINPGYISAPEAIQFPTGDRG